MEHFDQHFEGAQQLSYMHPALKDKLADRVRQVIVNWPELVIDSLVARLRVLGFRIGGQDKRDDQLWRVWQANDLDLLSQQATVDALVMGRAYVIVGSNEADPSLPLVTVESPLQVFHEVDPRTRKLRAAVKRWTDDADSVGTEQVQWATLYLPDRTVTLRAADGATWEVVQEDVHELGVVPVVPLLNRPRTFRKGKPLGVSEIRSVIPLADAVCKLATDMMVSAEFHASPRRYALGFTKEDFTDADGRPLTPWEAVAGVLWASEKSPKEDGVAVGQFPEASLTNFIDAIGLFARLVAGIAALPPEFLGELTANPASADAIRSSRERLIMRCQDKQLALENAWEQVMRLVLLVRDGVVPPQAYQMETMWADPATPTFAAKADAVVKLHAADRLLPRRAARRELGYSPGQIADMEAEDAEAYTRAADPASAFGPKFLEPEAPAGDEDEFAEGA
ncbi:phage portal protein [Allokutzneria sp. A3M-2-11 16]|nr:phage portal protein [Allokutzneria sp. A3M-2-11 16]